MNQKLDFIQDDFQTNIQKVVNNYEIFVHNFVEILDKDISESDVKAAVSKLKCNKSAGNDSIVNDMIKAAAELLSPTLCKLFSIILDKGYFPGLLPPPPPPPKKKEWRIGSIAIQIRWTA